MDDILEDEKNFNISMTCYRRSEDFEQFENCINLFAYFFEDITKPVFIQTVNRIKKREEGDFSDDKN